MPKHSKYFIVEASALPEVFLKVAETKHLLENGTARTVNDAARITGISRSAFYKYRDAIYPFQDLMAGRIITFQMICQVEDPIAFAASITPPSTSRKDCSTTRAI